MGYDAYVNCNCYEEGKVKTRPPHEHLLIKTEGGWELSVPREGNEKIHQEYNEWFDSNPCEHDMMSLADEHLANIWGMGKFRYLIQRLGRKDYPVLTEYLPKPTDGSECLPYIKVHQLIRELKQLNTSNIPERRVVLEEVNTKKSYSTPDLEHGEFLMMLNHGKIYVDFTSQGFQIIKNSYRLFKKRSIKVFTATHFILEKVGENGFKFINLQNGETFSTKEDIDIFSDIEANKKEFKVYEKDFHIKESYEYILKPLELLAAASLATKNNIEWC